MLVSPSPVTPTADEDTRLRNDVRANTVKAASAGVVPVALLAGNDGIQTDFNLTMVKQVLDGDDWKQKVSVLRQLEVALTEGSLVPPNPGELVPFMESMAMLFRDLKDTKPDIPGGSRITQLAAGVVGGLAEATKDEIFCASAAGIIPELLSFLSTPREAVQESVTACVKAILTECHSPGVLRAATLTLANSKKAHQRRKASSFLCVAIERWPQAALHAALSPIMGMMRKALLDADATVRREGRQTFGAFIKVRPAEGGGMYHGLDRAIQRAILQEQPHVSNFIGGKTGPAPAKESGDAGGSGDKDGDSWVSPSALVGGGGGQRPAGVTVVQAQQLKLLRWKREKEKEKEREKEREKEKHGESVLLQERRAATALGTAMSAPNSPAKSPSRSYSYTSAVATGPPTSIGIDATSVGREKKRSGMVSGVPSPKAGVAGRRRGGGGVGGGDGDGLAVNPGSIPRSPGSRAPKVSCSQGLRDAAKVSVRKHDVLSPRMKKLLQEETDRMSAVVAGGGGLRCDTGERNGAQTSPHPSEEKVVSAASSHGRDTAVEAEGGVDGPPLQSPRSQESQGPEDGVDVDVSRTMTPAELRQSMAGDNKEHINSAATAVSISGDTEGVISPGALGGRRGSGSGVSDGGRRNGDTGRIGDGERDGSGAGGDFAGTTRMLFATVKAGEGNGERNATTKGGRSTVGLKSGKMTSPLSQRAPSSLPRISPPSSPRSNSHPDHVTTPPSGKENRRSMVSSAASAVSSTKDYRTPGLSRSFAGSPLSIAAGTSTLLHDNVETPKRHGILADGGTSTRGKNTEARRQVRFTDRIDAAAASMPGSLTSPCNAGSSGRSAARESWWTPTGHENPETSATAVAGRERSSSLRLVLLNVFLLMSTLGAFAVLSLMLAIRLENHGFEEKNLSPGLDMIAEPSATETTTEKTPPWAFPPPEKIMPDPAPRLLVENEPSVGNDSGREDEKNRKKSTTARELGGGVAEKLADVDDPSGSTMGAVEMPGATETEAANDSPSVEDEVVETAAVEGSCESAAGKLDAPPAVSAMEVGTDNEDIADAVVVAAITEEHTDVNAIPLTTVDKVETPMLAGLEAVDDSPSKNDEEVAVAAMESSCESASTTLDVPPVKGVVDVGTDDEDTADALVAAAVTEKSADADVIPSVATADTVETPVVTETEATEDSPSEEDEGAAVAAMESSCESSSPTLDALPAEDDVDVDSDGEDIAVATSAQPRPHDQTAELPQARRENGGEVKATEAVASSGSAMKTGTAGPVFPAPVPSPAPTVTTREGSGGRSLPTATAGATVAAMPPITTSTTGSYQRRATPRSQARSTAEIFNRPQALADLGAGWGWLEFWVAVAGAVALLASVVWVASVDREGEGPNTLSSDVGAGTTGDVGPTTPTKNGDTQYCELGTYTTVEVVKTGNTPATIRSVKRSRRISSAHKSSRAGTVVMDLGATATTLNLN